MSLNHRGQITGQVVHPLVALSDRKQKRHLTHPHPPPPAGDIIEISSDEDEDPQPPPKKVLINIEHPSSTHEPDYKARLFQKDREIENLKKVCHRPLQFLTAIRPKLTFGRGKRSWNEPLPGKRES